MKFVLNKYLMLAHVIQSYRIVHFNTMGNYKLYVAVIAIACIAIQGVSCAAEYEYDESEYNDTDESNATVENEVESQYDCDEYQAKIWDKALGNPAAMQLVEKTMATVKELGTDEVCSDASRTFLNFVGVMGTSPNAHYSIGMFMKMIAVIMREVNTSEISDQLQETGKVVERIFKEAEIQKLTSNAISRSANLLKDPVTRDRLFRVLQAVAGLTRPSENEIMVKNSIGKVKGMAAAPVNMVKGAMGRVGSIFQKTR